LGIKAISEENKDGKNGGNCCEEIYLFH